MKFTATIKIEGTDSREEIIKSLKEIAAALEDLPPATGMPFNIKMDNKTDHRKQGTINCTYSENNEQ